MTDTALETFLAPLARLAAKHPDIEGAVVWAEGDAWQPQDDTTELLDAEEIAFYAEGLLLEGFNLVWQAIAALDHPKTPDEIVLMFWQGTAPPLPAPPPDCLIMAQGTWQGGLA